MRLTLTPEEMVPIVREHLERKLNLTLSSMNFIRQPQMDPERNEQWFIQLDVQPAASAASAATPEVCPSGWRDLAIATPPPDSVIVWGKRDASRTVTLGNSKPPEGFTYWMLVPTLP